MAKVRSFSSWRNCRKISSSAALARSSSRIASSCLPAASFFRASASFFSASRIAFSACSSLSRAGFGSESGWSGAGFCSDGDLRRAGRSCGPLLLRLTAAGFLRTCPEQRVVPFRRLRLPERISRLRVSVGQASRLPGFAWPGLPLPVWAVPLIAGIACLPSLDVSSLSLISLASPAGAIGQLELFGRKVLQIAGRRRCALAVISDPR